VNDYVFTSVSHSLYVSADICGHHEEVPQIYKRNLWVVIMEFTRATLLVHRILPSLLVFLIMFVPLILGNEYFGGVGGWGVGSGLGRDWACVSVLLWPSLGPLLSPRTRDWTKFSKLVLHGVHKNLKMAISAETCS